MGREIEFAVHTLEKRGSAIYVAGRCYMGPLHLGDIFTEAAFVKEAESGKKPQLGAQKPISLRLVKIEAYKHELEELHPGMTAGLTLTGDGEALAPDMIIASR